MIRYEVATLDDVPFLKGMLFEAAYWRPERERPTLEEGLAHPDIGKIMDGWGRDGDLAIVARDESGDLGAAFIRFWTENNHSYGFVNESIPELAIGVVSQRRGQGIGRELVRRICVEALDRGVESISLSVERDNPARNLYQSLGFETVAQVDNADTMVKQLQSAAP